METMAATAATSSVTSIVGCKSNVLRNRPSGASSVLGFTAISMKGKVKSAAEEKSLAKSLLHLASVCAATTSVVSGPAIALVDERMSTEGTGLPFGLSNNLLVWILLGVFGLIWAFYVTYASSLDEDDDSGLSL